MEPTSKDFLKKHDLKPEHMEYIIDSQPDFTKEELHDVIYVDKVDDESHKKNFDPTILKKS